MDAVPVVKAGPCADELASDLFARVRVGRQCEPVVWEERGPEGDFELRECRHVGDCLPGQQVVQSAGRYADAIGERPLTRLTDLLGQRRGKRLSVDGCVKVLFHVARAEGQSRIGPMSTGDEFDGCAPPPTPWARRFRIQVVGPCLHLGTLPRLGGVTSTQRSDTLYVAQYIAYRGGGRAGLVCFAACVCRPRLRVMR